MESKMREGTDSCAGTRLFDLMLIGHRGQSWAVTTRLKTHTWVKTYSLVNLASYKLKRKIKYIMHWVLLFCKKRKITGKKTVNLFLTMSNAWVMNEVFILSLTFSDKNLNEAWLFNLSSIEGSDAWMRVCMLISYMSRLVSDVYVKRRGCLFTRAQNDMRINFFIEFLSWAISALWGRHVKWLDCFFLVRAFDLFIDTKLNSSYTSLIAWKLQNSRAFWRILEEEELSWTTMSLSTNSFSAMGEITTIASLYSL